MGVYISMDMPKEIEPALVIDFCEDQDGKRYARLYHYRYGGITDWHELIEVPEPHGRLIDADAIPYKKIMYDDDDFYYGVTKPYIDRIPTIIPASKEVSA